MVHGLAAQLGGALIIRSRPGLGTSVELWLPIAEAGGPDPRRPQAAAPHPAAGIALLVDDEDLVRATTAEMLSEIGYQVVEARSAAEALNLTQQGLAPDVVVTDHLMPGLSGVDLARQLGERGIHRVLIISGYAEDEGVSADLPRLTKPFRQAELATALAGLFAEAPRS